MEQGEAAGVALQSLALQSESECSAIGNVALFPQGWRRYQICRGCLESCHTQTFSPLPPDEDGVSVERGAVCLGRSSGKYYFILCRDMREKFCLPLAASFKVVGRVTKNLSSLDEVVRAITSAEQRVSIIPQRQRIRTSSVEY